MQNYQKQIHSAVIVVPAAVLAVAVDSVVEIAAAAAAAVHSGMR